MMSRISLRPRGSRPPSGSSRMTSDGSLIRAWASPMRWSMPRENLRSGRSGRPLHVDELEEPGDPLLAFGLGDAEELGVEIEEFAGRQIIVEVGIFGKEPDVFLGPGVEMGTGRTASIVPASGKIRPRMHLMVVVLPAPFGPRYPKISPSATVRRKCL